MVLKIRHDVDQRIATQQTRPLMRILEFAWGSVNVRALQSLISMMLTFEVDLSKRVAWARNHLQADRPLQFRFEIAT
jgi:hypothetical protein